MCAVLRRSSAATSSSSQSAASFQSVSRNSGRKNPKWPIFAAPICFGAIERISGLVAVKPEHSSSTIGSVAHGSSVKLSARTGRLVLAVVGERLQVRVVVVVALVHHPVGPLHEHALRQVLADAELARRVAQKPRDRPAEEFHHGVGAIVLRRRHQRPVAGLRRDQQAARDHVVVRKQADRLSAERVADDGERQALVASAHPGHRGRDVERRPVRHGRGKARRAMRAASRRSRDSRRSGPRSRARRGRWQKRGRFCAARRSPS